MKIYIAQNNQRLGPYTNEEARDLVYSGKILRTALACPEGGTEWVPLATLLEPPVASSNVSAPAMIAVPIEKLRDPNEMKALTFLYVAATFGVVLLLAFWVALPIVILLSIMVFVGELWFAAYLRTNAVRVSKTQLPDLFRVIENSCARLQMAQPDVYVMQQNTWNAFATKIWGRRMVVLLSGAVDSILLKGDMQQMAWLVGHELGHHFAGHLDFSRKLASLGNWCVWLRLWYSRRCELTCDRVGLYCAGSLKASQLALLNATVGAQLASQVNVAEAAAQWHLHRREFFVQYRTLYATHPHHLARLDHLMQSAVELGVAN